jgi:hypothetical protein
LCTCCSAVQLLLEQWFYRRAVDALKKGGTDVPNTYELRLIEEIQAAQAAAGVTVEYPGWQAVPLLEGPLPAFGLEFQPRPLLDAAAEADWDGERQFRRLHRSPVIAVFGALSGHTCP